MKHKDINNYKGKSIRILICILAIILLIILMIKGCTGNKSNINENKKPEVNIDKVDKINGAEEDKKPIVDIDKIDFSFVLPNKDSSIKYTINIKNTSDINKTLDDLIVKKINNPNIDYEIMGVSKDHILKPGESIVVEIIFKNKGEGSSDNIKVEVDYTLKDIYIISYNLNGGTADIKAQTKRKDEVIKISDTIPKKDGYIFKGYGINNDKIVKYNPGDKYSDNKNITLYAIYEPIKYNITYNGNGSTNGSMSDSIHVYDEEKALTNNKFNKKGHTFVGWSLSHNGNKVYDNGQIIKNLTNKNGEKINLYALWQRNKYTLSIRLDGGNLDGIVSDFTKELMYEEQFKLGIPKKLGYTFIGYSISETGNVINNVSGDSTITMGDSNTILTANYIPNTYKITLNNDSEDQKGTTILYEKYDRGIFLDESLNNLMTKTDNPIIVPKKSGYIFNGYYTKINNQEVKVIDKNGYVTDNFKSNMFTANIEIFAKWRTDAYILTLDNQNADDKGTKEIYVKYLEGFYLDPEKQHQMSSIDNSIENPKKNGYTFEGYYTKPNGEGDKIINEDGFIIESANSLFKGDSTIYANYISNPYVITLDNENNKIYSRYGEGIYIDEDYTKEMTEGLNPIVINNKDGYIFKGYYTKPNGEGKLMIDSNGYITKDFTSKTFSKDTTLYSYVIPISYKVKYNSNSLAEGTMDDSTYTYDKTSKLRKNSYVRLGYTFMGWSTSSDSNTVAYNDEDEILNLTNKNNSEIILYAVWQINSYTLTIDLNGGTLEGIPLTQSVTYASEIKLTNPVKDGYTFERWEVSGNGSYINEKENVLIVGNEDVNLTAKYKENIYEITLNNNNATTEGTTKLYEKYNVGIYLDEELKNELTSENKIELPTKEGYAFDGYYTLDNILMIDSNANLTTDFVNTITKENITLYAKWTINTYTVTFINEGNQYGDVQNVNYNGNITIPESPTKLYYSFNYWSQEENGNMYDLSTPVTDNITLYAVYSVNNYTVTLVDKGEIISEQEVEAGTLITVPEVEKEGYTFKYWSLNENGEEYNLLLPVEDNIKLYSVYEINSYDIEFYDNDALLKTLKVNYDSEINNDEIPKITSEEGYIFVGWYEKDSNTTFDFSSKIRSNKKLYSKYEKIKNGVVFNDENRVTIVDVEYGNKVNPIENQGKTGYTFSHWSLSVNGEEFDFNTEIKESITLYAVYNINTYTVTFIDGDTQYGEVQNISYNGNITILEEPQKIGYTFSHWSLSVNGESYDLNTKVTSNLTLYAVYTVNTYTVTFIDGDTQYGEVQNINYGGEITKPQNPTKEGYVFSHWSLSVNGESYDLNTKVTSNLTLYAVYQVNRHTLTIDPNGGSYNGSLQIQTFNMEYNETMNVIIPVKEGYTFTGWIKVGNGDISSLTENSTFTMNTEDTILTATYRINSYTLIIDPNGGLWNENTQVQTFNMNYQETKEIPIPTREGYMFTGWVKEGNGNIGSLTEDTIFEMNTESTTLTAGYTANTYEIVLDNKGASVSGTTKIYEKYETGLYIDTDLTTKVDKITIPIKDGYTFAGYYTEENGTGTKLIDENGNITTNLMNNTYKENVTIYADYIINSYNLTINYNDGLTPAEVYILNYQETKEIIAPVREGYIFAGWNLTGEGSTINSLDDNSVFTMGSENAVLTASYNPITYQIKYDGNGATSGSMSNSIHTYDTNSNLTTNTYLRNGYTFKGWSTSNSSTIAIYEDSDSIINLSNTNNAIVTLYAVWEVSTYTLTINPNTGLWNDQTTNQTFDIEYNSTKVIEDPTKEGYTFSGWTVTGEGSSISDMTFIMGYENTTLIANYNPNKYTITLDSKDATIIGTAEIYEQYNTGIYLDNNYTKIMTESENAITIPEKAGYLFGGYYTEENGMGTQMITKDGYITSNLTSTKYLENITLYAKWTKLTASDLYYDSTNSGLNCDNVQCAIDKLNEVLGD